jgi:2-polyprenyl-3-methyl-5-hydroxy-6-metoxy-1,4-benzoquinol methylase
MPLEPNADYEALIANITEYWNGRIHDEEMSGHAPGTKGFFEDLADYRYDKNGYLLKLVDFTGYAGKKVLEQGCGVGLDLARFARGGAQVTGVDLAQKAIGLAKKNFELNGLSGDIRVMNAEALDFPDACFDLVYAHGVLPYVADERRLVSEALRVLKPGGESILQAYNRKGWLKYMSRLFKVPLEHREAPAYRMHTINEFKDLFSGFSRVKIIPERFPVKSRLHKGWKGMLYNGVFVGAFKIIPRPLVRRWGFHLMAFAVK